MKDNTIKGNIFNTDSNVKIDSINDKTELFDRLKNLQTLIKKESYIKELCKNLK